MRNLKIGYDAKRAFHNYRGLGVFSRTLIDGMCSYHSKNSYYLFTPTVKDKRGLEWRNKKSGFSVIEPDNFVAKNMSSVWRSVLLSNVVKDYNLDIYHGLSHELPPGIEKLNLKSVVTIHDLLFLRFPQNFNWIDRQVYKLKFQKSCEHADRVLAICEQTKNDIVNFLNIPEDKIDIVYQACDPAYYLEASDERKREVIEKYSIRMPFVLSVGAYEENKNQLTLVKAFNKVRSELGGEVLLVGRGDAYKEIINDHIKMSILEDKVRFLEDVPLNDLAVLYQLARCSVYPSFFEGFGLPIIESLFSKTPVICSQGSCFPESGGDAAYYFDPNSVDELSQALLDVCLDEDRSADMVAKGLKYCQKFHIETTSNNLNNVYHSLLTT